jgi:hypothetical protein
MRLVDFLKALLEAHAQTLQRLAALFGEETLFAMLEEAGDSSAKEMTLESLEIKLTWFKESIPDTKFDLYREIEGTVNEFRLSPVLEFHLWAYPYYRVFIESSLGLSAQIDSTDGVAGNIMVEEAIRQAAAWMRRLPIPPAISAQAERAAQIPWLRFRSEILKRIGQRPVQPV